MKLDDSTRFPHPVLWSVTGDFLEGSFTAGAIQVVEELSSGQVTLQVNLELAHVGLRHLVEAEKANAGVIVECGDTYLSRVYPLVLGGGTVRFEPGQVSGRVVIRPVLWSKYPIAAYRPDSLHGEFGADGCAMTKGALLAIAEEQVIEVGREKLAPIETIFELALNPDVPEHEFRVDVEKQRIVISAAKQTLEDIAGMRNSHDGKAVLLSAVYLPVLMSVIEGLQVADSSHDGKRWYDVLTAKLSSLGIDVLHCDALVAAQQLLKAPFGRTATAYRKGQN